MVAPAALTQQSLLGHILSLAKILVGAPASAQEEEGYWFKFQLSVFPRYQPSCPAWDEQQSPIQ